jgi:proline dehydrogenase
MQPMRSFFLALSRSERLRQMATKFGPAQAVVRRFVAGETLEEAIAVVHQLNQEGLHATLDHLGEEVTSASQAGQATAQILGLLEATEASDVQSGVSIKLTQLGLAFDPDLATENLERIVDRAAQASRFVRIDMESSEYVQPTLDLFEALWHRHKNLGVVIQSYLHRSDRDIALLIELGAPVRLVKGAYDEPPEIAYAQKSDTDASFVRLMEQLFSARAQANGVFPAIATHDTTLIEWARAHTRRQNISSESFEFQMLYGIRPGLQRQLATEGYRVRVYVPYGEQWYPYFMRRLAERPANVLFLLRNLLRA